MSHLEDAHREAHRNLGVPMGLPIRWDYCFCDPDPDYMESAEYRRLCRIADVNAADMRGEEGSATIRCGNCGQIHRAVRYVRECYATA